MNIKPAQTHTPFAVDNPIAADPDTWEREVALPLRAAELRRQADGLRERLASPSLELGERAAVKRQIQDLQRRIDDLGVDTPEG